MVCRKLANITKRKTNMRDYKREAAKFLMHIFDQDMVVCATIATAEAEGNIQVLLDALKTVNAYVNELKTGLKKDTN